MTLTELDECIRKYLAGDAEVFDLIYYETQRSVYLSIKVIIKKEAVIEDLMQDAYMKALDNLQSYKLGTNFKAWISKIARNLAINHYNRSKREDIREETDAVFKINSLDEEGANTEGLHYYLSFLEGLERDIIVYHLILGMKFKEISEIVETPLSTVFFLYKKAVGKIKKSI